MIDDVALPVGKSLGMLVSTRLPKGIRPIRLVMLLIGVWIFWRELPQRTSILRDK